MDENRMRQIAEEVYNRLGTQWGVAKVPAHIHNGLDANFVFAPGVQNSVQFNNGGALAGAGLLLLQDASNEYLHTPDTSDGTTPLAIVIYTGNASAGGDGADALLEAGSTTSGAAGRVFLYAGNSDTQKGGNVVLNSGAGNAATAKGDFLFAPGGSSPQIATASTSGFVYIPNMNGTPTGVPAQGSSTYIPMVFDTSANRLWIYNGSWLKSAAFT